MLTPLILRNGYLEKFIQNHLGSKEELSRYFPMHYWDYTTPVELNEDMDKSTLSFIIGTMISVRQKTSSTGKLITYIFIKDKLSGMVLKLMMFGVSRMFNLYKSWEGKEVAVGAFIEYDKKYGYSASKVKVITPNIAETMKIVTQYRKIKKVPLKALENAMEYVETMPPEEETLSKEIMDEFGLIGINQAIHFQHFPKNMDEVFMGQKRTIFDNMLFFALSLNKMKHNKGSVSEFKITSDSLVDKYKKSLPFTFTTDQEDTSTKIINEMKQGYKVNALIQGDTGSGKTAVSVAIMLAAVSSGYQAVLMAPTAVLASQHYQKIKEELADFGVNVVFYCRKAMPEKELKIARQKIESGEANIIIGTSGVFSKQVEYKNLAIIVTDEEHKFGVIQKHTIKYNNCHSILMSATPIPSTLTSTLFDGIMDIYSIKTNIPGRLQIKSCACKLVPALKFIKEKIDAGEQAYIVCRAIDKKEASEDVADDETTEEATLIYNVTDMYEECKKIYGDKCAMLTGKTKKAEADRITKDFASGKIKVLIATIVVEVGMDVKGATCIAILNANYFGLASLQQLRGRVGRNSKQGYCMFVTDVPEDKKIKVMTSTTDGFIISEEDFKMRGPGNPTGVEQSGNNNYMTWAIDHKDEFEKIKGLAEDLYQIDNLTYYKHMDKYAEINEGYTAEE